MAPTADCRFGERCTRENCSFRHPPIQWVECGKFGDKRCRDAALCQNAKCGFAHPANWAFLQPIPPPAQPPPQPPIQWVECGKFGDKRCNKATDCQNAKCGFAHPENWAFLQPPDAPPTRPVAVQPPQSPPQPPIQWVVSGKFGEKRCRMGGACQNAQCGFAHPEDWTHFHGTKMAEISTEMATLSVNEAQHTLQMDDALYTRATISITTTSPDRVRVDIFHPKP